MNYWKLRELIERTRKYDLARADLEKLLKREYRRLSKEIMDQIELLYRQISGPLTADQLYRNERYWQLISDIDAKLNGLGMFEQENMTETFKNFYYENYNLNATFNFPISEIKIEKALESLWAGDGKNFSDRIWTNKRALIEKLRSGLINSAAAGQNWAELSKEIKRAFGVSYNQASRLVRTELTHIQTEATIDKYKSEGVEQVRFIAENDCCPECMKYKDQVFPVDKAPLPPIHCNCRCTILAIVK